MLNMIGEAVSRRAGVESVFGTPIQAGERTLIPVARIQYGFGGGDNAGNLGGGGGMEAVPLGLVEVGPQGVLFHPIPVAGSELGGIECREEGPGVFRLGRPDGLACWLLAHGTEGALVNAPPDAALSSFLVRQAHQMGIRLRHILLTQADYLHCGGLQDVLRAFPDARLVAHRAVEHASSFPPRAQPGDPEDWRANLPLDGVRVHTAFDDGLWTGSLEGEPLLLLYAPLHSWTDQVVVFRGTLLGGDPGSGPAEVPTAAVPRVLAALKSNLSGYHLHTVVGGGEFLEGIDE